jgi:hypothetical protein
VLTSATRASRELNVATIRLNGDLARLFVGVKDEMALLALKEVT